MRKETKILLMGLGGIALVVLMLVTAIVLPPLLSPKPDKTVGDIEPLPKEPVDLSDIEVKEYKGEKLGSTDDFRENSILGPQYFAPDEYRLNVTGLVEKDLEMTYEEILEKYDHYRKVVTLNCVEGWSVKILWEGVLVRDILEEAGVLNSSKVIIFHAKDGYTTSMPVSYFYDNDILMAYGMNNITLPPKNGWPFQLVAESKWGYKWIKWITQIEVSDDEDYKGFWEERGYNNNGDLDDGFFE